jgi:hypothetical protein
MAVPTTTMMAMAMPPMMVTSTDFRYCTWNLDFANAWRCSGKIRS